MTERKRPFYLDNVRQPEPMTQPYTCATCGKIGAVEHWSDDDAAQLCDDVRQVHRDVFGCAGSVQFSERYKGRPTSKERTE